MSTKPVNPNRRQFMRRVGTATAGAGAAYYGGTRYAGSPAQNAQAALPIAAGIVAAAGVGYIIGTVNDHFSGLGDSNAYSDKQEEALYYQARQDAELIKLGNERTLVQANNLLANAKSAAYQIGRAKFLERLNEGDDVPTARTASKDDITAYFVPTQKNVIERWDVMVLNIQLAVDRSNSLGTSQNWQIIANTPIGPESKNITQFNTRSYTFLDGSTMDYHYPYNPISGQGDGSVELSLANRGGGFVDNAWLRFNGGYGDSTLTLLKSGYSEWQNLLNRIQQKHDEAIAELDAFADGIKDQYIAGEISAEELVTPRDLWQMSSDDAENPYAAADLAGLGLEVNQESSLVIDLLDDGTQLEGSVYLSEPPIGESLAAGNVYDPTISRSTDIDGNPDDTIDDYGATEADPVPLDGLAFIAYNTSAGESTYGQIQQPFEVLRATGENGNQLAEVSYQPATGQQTTTTDVDELRNELQSMNDEINRLEEERRELADDSSGGGGVDLTAFAGLPTGVVIAVVAAVAAFLYGK